jgi:hypothetical protein
MNRSVNMTRAKTVRLPGQPLKPRYKGGAMKTAEGPDHNAEMASGRWGASKYWQLRLDECDKFSDVKVYDGKGNLIRTVEKKALIRPMPLKPGQGWNTVLFPSTK